MKEKQILTLVNEKLNIPNLNPMQQRMLTASSEQKDIILLSPTGSGKTVAFLIPLLKWLKPSTGRVQAIIIAPSRELVIQTAEVTRAIAEGFKVTPLYGGHKVEDEINSLSQSTDIVVVTPGRLLDHIRRRNIDVMPCRIVVLDEFDKSLELGFEEEMSKIFSHLKNMSHIIMTSATNLEDIPSFVGLSDILRLDFLDRNSELRSRIKILGVKADSRDKLDTLYKLINNLANTSVLQRTIIFVNHRESAERVANFLKHNGADVALYHGALDQHEREKSIARFNNGSSNILVATDLAARGLDIDSVANVIHYHIPPTSETYTHRNGRTARVNSTGNVYVIIPPESKLPDYIKIDDYFPIKEETGKSISTGIKSIYISAGKKEKLSKGDIVGFLIKECGIIGSAIGRIDLRDHYAVIALPMKDAIKLDGTSQKIKGQKRKLSVLN